MIRELWPLITFIQNHFTETTEWFWGVLCGMYFVGSAFVGSVFARENSVF